MSYYTSDDLSAFDAISYAQKITFSPVLFQVAFCIREFGILGLLDKNGKRGATLEDLMEVSKLQRYSVNVLMDMALSGGIAYQDESERYYITKAGQYLQNDEMTIANLNFIKYVCYQGLDYLYESLKNNKPEGLKVLGPWETIYPGLSSLNEKAKKAWFAFDHLYSDVAVKKAIEYVFSQKVGHLYDLGGNTGKFSIACTAYDKDVHVTILDLKEQIALAKDNIKEHSLENRVSFKEVNVLNETLDFPTGADVWWMSQFLDCFDEDKVVHILRSVASVIDNDCRVCILEPFNDNQKFEAAAYSINASSLYFTTMANGKSKFFSLKQFLKILDRAGLAVHQSVENLGLGHTLLICKKK